MRPRALISHPITVSGSSGRQGPGGSAGVTGRSSPCRSAPRLSLQLPGLEAGISNSTEVQQGCGDREREAPALPGRSAGTQALNLPKMGFGTPWTAQEGNDGTGSKGRHAVSWNWMEAPGLGLRVLRSLFPLHGNVRPGWATEAASQSLHFTRRKWLQRQQGLSQGYRGNWGCREPEFGNPPSQSKKNMSL